MTKNTAVAKNVRTRQEWAEIINADLHRSIESIIQTGRDLIAAKGEIPEGEFMKMVEIDLPFSHRTANKFMSIAKHPGITDSTAAANLPPKWAVLSELATLTAEDFQDAQRSEEHTSELQSR